MCKPRVLRVISNRMEKRSTKESTIVAVKKADVAQTAPSKATLTDTFSINISPTHPRFAIEKLGVIESEATLPENYIYTPDFEPINLVELKKGNPGKRIKEDLSEDTFLNRHKKNEALEKKMLKWDREWVAHMRYREMMYQQRIANSNKPDSKPCITRSSNSSNLFLSSECTNISIKLASPTTCSFSQEARLVLLEKYYAQELRVLPNKKSPPSLLSAMPTPKRRKVQSALSSFRKRLPPLPVRNLEDCIQHMHIVRN